jgi:hypothetical protein
MVVKAAPAAPFTVAETDLLLELLVVSFNPPARLGDVDEALERGARGRLESQYLLGSSLPSGHSISNHSSGQGSERRVSRCPTDQARGLKAHGRTRRAAKREVGSLLLPHARSQCAKRAWAGLGPPL